MHPDLPGIILLFEALLSIIDKFCNTSHLIYVISRTETWRIKVFKTFMTTIEQPFT